MINARKTNYDFKTLYFFGILFIVLGHAGGNLGALSTLFPFHSFHVAIFIIASGYFTKKEKNPLSFALKTAKRLLVPLYTWVAFFAVLIVFLYRFGIQLGNVATIETFLLDPLFPNDCFGFTLGTWFIYPLFFTKTIHAFLDFCLEKALILTQKWGKNASILPQKQGKNEAKTGQNCPENRAKIGQNWGKNEAKIGQKCPDFASISSEILCILYLVLGFFGMKFSSAFALPIARVLEFLPFFAFGLLYRKVEAHPLPIPVRLALCLLFNGVVLLILGAVPVYDQALVGGYDNPALAILLGISGTLFWLNIAKLMPKVGELKFVSYIGDHTLEIMILHGFGFFVLKVLFSLANAIGLFPTFDFHAFATNPWYVFLPWDMEAFRLLYLLFGVGISLLVPPVQKLLNMIMKK